MPAGSAFVAEDLAAGPQPSRQDLERLAEAGFRTVVNLRRSGEEAQPMSPNDEGNAARALGMEYQHIPVAPDKVEPAHLDRFQDALERLPAPAFVHCGTADRAVAFAVAREALRRGTDADAELRRAAERGLECGEALSDVVRSYVEERGASAPGKPEVGRRRP